MPNKSAAWTLASLFFFLMAGIALYMGRADEHGLIATLVVGWVCLATGHILKALGK